MDRNSEEYRNFVKQLAIEVIDDYMAKHGTKPFTTANRGTDIAKEALKKCHKKYQKNVLDKLIDDD